MGRSQRDKGARFERKIANWLSEVLDTEVNRQTNETQQGNMGDVVASLSPSILLVVQAKHQSQPSPWRAMQEAEEAATSRSEEATSVLPVGCVRRHGGEDLVTMRPADFSKLLQAAELGDYHARRYGFEPTGEGYPW